jgi:succinate-semialdehyde dehydrogenase/glutarate-semialdehyde dehydrogenase
MFKSINPFNDKVLYEFEEDSHADISQKISLAGHTFQNWKDVEMDERSSLFIALAEELRDQNEELAELATLEMGKPIKQAKAEVEKCAWLCEHYAENGAKYLADHKVKSDGSQSWVSYEPLGVILGVMPWNFPFWQAFRFAVPTILAGNTALVKHASNVQGCAGEIQQLFESSGFPKGTYQNLRISSKEVAGVIEHNAIKATSLTGSEKAGSAVAQKSGAEIKKSLLELGGSNAFIVLVDADLEKTADLCVNARMQNNGQSCIAAKRIILEESIADQFTRMLIERIENLKVGDPMEEDVDVGPVAREDLAADLEKQMNESIKKGASLEIGGERNKAHFSPALLKDVTPGMPAFDEETFGPLLSVIVAKSADHAIELCNQSKFGLGATICSSNIDKAIDLARKVEDGAVFINELVKSDPRLPFGGTKISGYGRELGEYGIREFVNIKTYYVK